MTSPGFSQRVSELLEPISAEQPCGNSLRYDAAFDRLREMRREDDTSLPTGVWSTSEVKRADWVGVERLATLILRERSKDLMAAAWLGEAWMHREGTAGMVNALALLGGLCERYPDEVHPLMEDGDPSWRAAPLEWMARRYEEVLLTRLQVFPQLPDDLGPVSLYDWRQMKTRQVQVNDSKPAKVAAEAAQSLQKRLDEQVRLTPLSWWTQGAQALHNGQAQLLLLDGWCDRHLGDAAPAFGGLRKTMQALDELYQGFISMHPPQRPPAEPEPQVPPQSPTTMSVAAAATEVRLPAGEPRTREEAYRQLLVIADYLARTEPHSPVPYLIRRGVEWGNKPLRELLGELINSDAEARRLWTLLGVL